jgi:anaerobic selenocysteine-containing dehydrogenase
VILINQADINRRNLIAGDVVDLHNYYDQTERVAHKFIIVAYPIPEKCCATYFPEANVLVPLKSVAEKSNTPTSKMVIITIKKAAVS